MTTITIPINKELQSFIESELQAGTSESKAHLVRYALGRLREERALSRLQEAEMDIKENRIYRGDLKKLLKSFSMQYLYTARFLRSLKKCEEAIQDDVFRAVKLFEKGKSDKVLKLHKLHGKFKLYHAFSVNFSYRVIVKKEKKAMYYVDVGTHDIYP